MRWMSRGTPPKHGSAIEAGGLPVKRGLPAFLLLILCCWHAGFLVFSIIPRSPGQDDRGSPPMDLYRSLTGGRQVWNMFESIPVLHSLDARLEGDDEKEQKMTAGCVLPGFKPYPKPEESRHYVLFHRLTITSGGVAFREAYLRKMAQLLPSHRGGAGANWSLVVDADVTRTLFHSRRDGQLSLRDTKTFTPGGTIGDSP